MGLKQKLKQQLHLLITLDEWMRPNQIKPGSHDLQIITFCFYLACAASQLFWNWGCIKLQVSVLNLWLHIHRSVVKKKQQNEIMFCKNFCTNLSRKKKA